MNRSLRLAAVTLAAVVASHAVAQQPAYGTKPDIIVTTPDKSAPLVDFTALVQLSLALGIVFLLVKFGLPKLLAKFGGKVSTGIGSTIKTCETAGCGNATLHVLEVRGRTLLVAASPTQVNLIADLTQPLTEEQKAEEAKPAFFELLDARKQESVDSLLSKAVVEQAPEPEPEPTKPAAKTDFEESLRLLTEAKARMSARQTETVGQDADSRRERLRKLTG